MPSVVTKIKDALHGDHDSREEYRSDGLDRNDDRVSGTHGHGSSNLPGSYPGETSATSQGRHQDGREYVPPHGSAVGQQSHNTGTGGALDPGTNQPHSRTTTTTQTSTHGGFGDASQRYGTTGNPQDRPLGEIQPGTRGHNEVTDDRNLMDPASQGTGSNVLDGSATGTNTSGGGLGHDSRSTGSNKLHRRDDPRGYDSNNTGHSTTHGSSNVASATGGHQGQGQHLREKIADPNDRHAGAGYGTSSQGQQLQSGDGTDRYDNQTRSSHHDPSRAAALGAGGVGAGLAASQIPDRSRRHDNDDPRYTSSGMGGNQQYDTAGSGTSRHDYAGRDQTGRDTGHGGIYNTVVGAGSDHDQSRGHGHGHGHGHSHTQGTHGTGIGSGSTTGPGPTVGGRPYESQPGATSGLSGQGHIPREAGDGRHTTSGGGSGLSGPGAAGIAAAGAGVGAAGAYGASRATHRDGDRGQPQGDQYTGTGAGVGAGTGTGTGFGTGPGSRGGLDSSTTSTGYPGQSQSQPQSQFQQPGGMGQGPMARDSNAVPGAGGIGSSSASSGVHGLESLPAGSRVLHRCTHCGQDNDISHYLKKDLAYRIDQQ